MSQSILSNLQASAHVGELISLGGGEQKFSITLRMPACARALSVTQGCVWVTLAGNDLESPRDLWVQAGQTLVLAPRQVLWVDGWPQAQFQIQPVSLPQTPKSVACRPRKWFSLSGWMTWISGRVLGCPSACA